MGPRDERIARNEGWLRAANERIERATEDFTESGFMRLGERAAFFCECGRRWCEARITVPVATYEAAHRARDHYVVLPGHETPEIEHVAKRHPHYLVVVKRPAAEDASESG